MTKEEIGTRTRNKGSGSSTVSSMGKKKGMSPKIRKPKKESKVERHTLCRSPQQGM
jgi:hypothetical protein